MVPKPAKYVLLLLVGAGAIHLAYFYYVQPTRKMIEDYQRAASPLPDVEAVEDLAKYQDARATKLLLKIAQSPTAFPQNREFAILALAKRGDGKITEGLAALLRPGEALAIQLAIVGPLLDRDCQRQCIRSVIEYFDLLHNGQSMPHPVSPSSKVSQSLENERQEVLRLAKELLTRNRSRTIEVLRADYGLGTATPAPFVLDLIADLHLTEACPLLLQSKALAEKRGNFRSDDWSVVGKVPCSQASHDHQ